jgi:hypothetical protein
MTGRTTSDALSVDDAVAAAPFGMRSDAIESFQGSNFRAETLPSSHEKPSHLLRRRIARLWLQKL